MTNVRNVEKTVVKRILTVLTRLKQEESKFLRRKVLLFFS